MGSINEKLFGDISTNKDNVENNPAENNNYEMVNHPKHYNKYDIEVIDMMRKIWGDDAVATWCKLTAFKYRMRLGEKPNNSIKQDLEKENFYLGWYLDYTAKLKEQLKTECPDVANTTLSNEGKILLKD